MNAEIEIHRPLDDDELDTLDDLLSQFPDSLSLEEMDGLFCALVVGPEVVSPAEWVPAVLGAEKPEWESDAQARQTIELLMRHWNTVATGFREDWSGVSAEEGSESMYFPLLDDPEESGHPLAEGWARGFRDGLEWMDDAHWDALEEDEDCVTLLNLIAAMDSGEKSAGHPLSDDERDEILSPLVAGLQYLYAFWRRYLRVVTAPRVPMRAPELPGRNDICPCGSGKKFKKCCGSPEKLH
ncbi:MULTISPECIES: UPF0149 family protein [Niveibacterium]|uniref:UPF0149 family protein n=1 Tax=Niveibacterium microcysteis TaxID=2811415 RepID=A0ABX7MCQ7_9RHOO|nr:MULTISPECIES: UPF0149 family protein [Niveibacterium]QSI79289.1 UPF0149 family protein [Niveibacterium microcysteis]